MFIPVAGFVRAIGVFCWERPSNSICRRRGRYNGEVTKWKFVTALRNLPSSALPVYKSTTTIVRLWESSLMRRDDSIFLIYDQRNSSDSVKMTKAKTAVFLVVIICSCGLILSLPTPEPEAFGDDAKLGNNSRLVITHVVKTIEFEVGVVDDVSVDDNSTDPNASEFFETDIQLLNVDLLKEVVNQATGDNWEATAGPVQQAAGERKENAQVASDPLLPFNQSDS